MRYLWIGPAIDQIVESEDYCHTCHHSRNHRKDIKISKYHAVHKKTVQDLPILGNRTFLKLSLHEFDCDNQDCPCVSVTENFDGFLNEYSRMTERLADFITELALETSCEGTARILQSMNIKISGDTVIRTLLKRFENQDIPSCVSSVGVDDFTFKKRHKYGTIIVDEHHSKPKSKRLHWHEN